jgi:hypothetical protein
VAYAVLDTSAIHGVPDVVARHLGPDQGPQPAVDKETPVFTSAAGPPQPPDPSPGEAPVMACISCPIMSCSPTPSESRLLRMTPTQPVSG